MSDPQFPLYRSSANGLNWYRIESKTVFTEVQRVGSRSVIHLVKAETFPEKVRILELIGLEHGCSECSPEEFEKAFAVAA